MSRIRGNLQSFALQGAWRLQNSRRVSFFNFGADFTESNLILQKHPKLHCCRLHWLKHCIKPFTCKKRFSLLKSAWRLKLNNAALSTGVQAEL